MFVAAGVLQWVDNKAMLASVSQSKGCGDQGCFKSHSSFDEYHCDLGYIFNYLRSPLWGFTGLKPIGKGTCIEDEKTLYSSRRG